LALSISKCCSKLDQYTTENVIDVFYGEKVAPNLNRYTTKNVIDVFYGEKVRGIKITQTNK
jgi:hypothetical protein